ncbi:MAG: PstS family phosphate ABC transporter substrate-binding protein [Myxococcales bacterium]|nr:PstS family phosphate ABC transporter substrate-binding protein [Myxococcales bacterium]
MLPSLVRAAAPLFALAVPFSSGACKGSDPNGASGTNAAPASGAQGIVIDGSSTVFPITEAVAEEFKATNPARVTIGVSGTGGGFKKFCSKETAISGASRPIKQAEIDACAKSGVEYVELPVAFDGIAVVVHPSNTAVEHLTTAELKSMWEPAAQKKILKWNQVREGWADKELHLFGAGVDSGTYDYFTEAVVGKEHSSRGDFTSSEDDNVLVKGVSGDTGALAFFGFAYYAENKAKLKAVPVDDGKDDNGKGAILPSPETIADGSYAPLSRPIFLYVNKAELERAPVAAFAKFYVENARKLAAEVGYIALPENVSALTKQRLADKKAGSMYGGKGSKVGASLADLLSGKGS